MTSEVDGISPRLPSLLCAPTGTTQTPERRNTPEQCTNAATTPSSPRRASLWVLVPSWAPSVSGMIGPPQTTFLQSRPLTCQFRIRAFFRAAGLVQGGSVPFCTLPPGGSVSSHCADHRGVYGKLCAVEQRQTVGDHFQTAVICSRPWMEVQILDTDVDRHPGTCLSADSCGATFQREPTATKNPA